MKKKEKENANSIQEIHNEYKVKRIRRSVTVSLLNNFKKSHFLGQITSV